MICIMCALDIEYSNIKRYFNIDKEFALDENCQISECNSGKFIIVKSGVGKELAGSYTVYVINKYSNISHILSTGIAGALAPNLNIGDIVIGDTILDYANSDIIKEYTYITDNNLYIKVSKSISSTLHVGKILSSDILLNNSIVKERLYNNYNVLCVEMESAGVVSECIKNNILFTPVKIISDLADDRAIISMVRVQSKITDSLGQLFYTCMG